MSRSFNLSSTQGQESPLLLSRSISGSRSRSFVSGGRSNKSGSNELSFRRRSKESIPGSDNWSRRQSLTRLNPQQQLAFDLWTQWYQTEFAKAKSTTVASRPNSVSRTESSSIDAGSATSVVSTLRTENERLISQIAQLNQKILDTTSLIKKASAEVSQLRSANASLTTTIDELKKAPVESKRAITITNTEKIQSLSQTNTKLEETINKIQLEKKTLEGQLNDKNVRLEEATSTIGKLNAEVKTLTEDLTRSKETITTLQSQVTTLQSQVPKQGEIRRLTSLVTDITSKNKNLEANIEKLEDQISELDTSVLTYKTKMSLREGEVKAYITRLQECQLNRDELERKLSGISEPPSRTIVDLEKKVQQLSIELDKTTSNLTESRASFEKQRLLIRQLEMDKQNEEKKVEGINNEIILVKSQLTILKRQLDQANRDKSVLTAKVNTLEDEKGAIEIESRKLTDKMTKLSEELRTVRTARDECLNNAEPLELSNLQLTTDVATYKKLAEDRSKKLRELEATLSAITKAKS